MRPKRPRCACSCAQPTDDADKTQSKSRCLDTRRRPSISARFQLRIRYQESLLRV